MAASIFIHDNRQIEQPVREIVERVGLAPIRDQIFPAPDSCLGLEYVMVGWAANLRDFIVELLKNGFGLAENVQLEISTCEMAS